MDGAGQAVLAGDTTSTDVPGLGTPVGASDLFVVKLNTSGTAIQRTLIGGSGAETMLALSEDMARALALDSSGNISVGASSTSTNFPTTSGAYDRSCGSDGLCNSSSSDGVIIRLTASGSLSYGTYLGAEGQDQLIALALDSSSAVYVTGETRSSGFPLRAYADNTIANYEAFVSKLNLAGGGDSDLMYSTFLGGASDDNGEAIAVDGTGSA